MSLPEGMTAELEQVGWWVGETHKHEPFRGETVHGEFRFTEELEGCPINAEPVYRIRREGDSMSARHWWNQEIAVPKTLWFAMILSAVPLGLLLGSVIL